MEKLHPPSSSADGYTWMAVMFSEHLLVQYDSQKRSRRVVDSRTNELGEIIPPLGSCGIGRPNNRIHTLASWLLSSATVEYTSGVRNAFSSQRNRMNMQNLRQWARREYAYKREQEQGQETSEGRRYPRPARRKTGSESGASNITQLACVNLDL